MTVEGDQGSDLGIGAALAAVDLDFHRALRKASSLECDICKQPISVSYYDLTDRVGCRECFKWESWNNSCDRLAGGFRSGCGGYLIAILVAAFIGRDTLDSVFLATLIVGSIVGKAVATGAGARGGLTYQAIAIAFVCWFLWGRRDEAVALFEPVIGMLPVLAGYEEWLLLTLGSGGFWVAWGANRDLAVKRNLYFLKPADRERAFPGSFVQATCSHCSIELAPRFVSCPACSKLVQSDQLKVLRSTAVAAFAAGRKTEALLSLREMLALLPEDSGQKKRIGRQVESLSRETDEVATNTLRFDFKTAGSFVAVLGLVLWKLKTLLFLAAANLKTLVVALKSGTTLVSMLASFLLLWSHMSWQLALGLIAAIYVHEIGHVVALRRLKIPATAPMFVPGLGAFVRFKQYPASPRDNALVGLAGPIWGLGATAFLLLIFFATGATTVGRIMLWSVWINLFNLLPIGPLDGGRGFSAIGRRDRAIITAVLFASGVVTNSFLLLLLAVVALFRVVFGPWPVVSDRKAFWQLIGLVICFGLIGAIEVPTSLESRS